MSGAFSGTGENVMDNAKKLAEYISKAERIVFFGGAGVSTESGIPDFRSEDGLYRMKFDYPPEEILSHDFFFEHTEYFYRFYREKMLAPDVLPNAAHASLKKLEDMGKLSAIVTQNIDGLHQAAGSENVFELHGTVKKNRCLTCGKLYDDTYIMNTEGVPKCSCGGLVKPEVVLYGEMLDDDTVSGAIKAISESDLLIVAGTSLTVYPAAGLITYFNEDATVLINRDPTPFDSRADLVIREKVGEVLKGALDILTEQ